MNKRELTIIRCYDNSNEEITVVELLEKIHDFANVEELLSDEESQEYNILKDEMYGCGDMVFESKASTKEVLQKYKITEKEYQYICQKLIEGLSFGGCGWCV